ncbi:DUF721 domain-containing protein [Candidatus Marithrix sp. Canyon 246]|uniref:DUF721 domain-containing protein n=1 Tax=Candidatus Marithrix sp. Canyon 246 TaxID=1827136 RepID=UPI00084A23DE|nr:DUF721 domain-containing protein [Candidatus Marithrix sp. Canyon 246]
MKLFGQLMINNSEILSNLSAHHNILKKLNHQLQEDLPKPLNQHCQVANFRDKILVIYTESSLWATRLRYIAPALIKQWQQDNLMSIIEQLEIKVRPLNKIVRH